MEPHVGQNLILVVQQENQGYNMLCLSFKIFLHLRHFTGNSTGYSPWNTLLSESPLAGTGLNKIGLILEMEGRSNTNFLYYW